MYSQQSSCSRVATAGLPYEGFWPSKFMYIGTSTTKLRVTKGVTKTIQNLYKSQPYFMLDTNMWLYRSSFTCVILFFFGSPQRFPPEIVRASGSRKNKATTDFDAHKKIRKTEIYETLYIHSICIYIISSKCSTNIKQFVLFLQKGMILNISRRLYVFQT